MRKSKNRYFYHIFVSPGAITLNVLWMEREFDAYKLTRCMCPSNYNRFWDRVRYWSKIVIFLGSLKISRRNPCVEFYLYPTVGTVLIHSVKPELTE